MYFDFGFLSWNLCLLSNFDWKNFWPFDCAGIIESIAFPQRGIWSKKGRVTEETIFPRILMATIRNPESKIPNSISKFQTPTTKKTKSKKNKIQNYKIQNHKIKKSKFQTPTSNNTKSKDPTSRLNNSKLQTQNIQNPIWPKNISLYRTTRIVKKWKHSKVYNGKRKKVYNGTCYHVRPWMG